MIKKNAIIISLLVVTGLFTACGNKKTDDTTSNSTSTVVASQNTVENKDEILKKEIQRLIEGYSKAELTLDYTKDTIETYKKVNEFLSENTIKNIPDVKYEDRLKAIKKSQVITNVDEVTINTVDKLEEQDTYKVTFTVKQNVIKCIEDGKDTSNTIDNIKGAVVITKENGKYLIRSFTI